MVLIKNHISIKINASNINTLICSNLTRSTLLSNYLAEQYKSTNTTSKQATTYPNSSIWYTRLILAQWMVPLHTRVFKASKITNNTWQERLYIYVCSCMTRYAAKTQKEKWKAGWKKSLTVCCYSNCRIGRWYQSYFQICNSSNINFF